MFAEAQSHEVEGTAVKSTGSDQVAPEFRRINPMLSPSGSITSGS